MKSASRKIQNFHLPLNAELYDQLREESSKTGVPATALVREALASWLRARKRRTLRNELKDYATAEAGSANDLDLEMESASIDLLTDE